jgi:MarR family transcriptional regulator, lower aerobic nicotinate degradation pathway regulator
MTKADSNDLGIVDGLVQLSFLIQLILGRIAARHELSIIQVRMLGVLRDREPGMLELAGALNLDKSSVTGLIDRAVRRGLVRRITTPEDRRAVYVGLAPRGRALAQAFAKEVARDLSLLLKDFSAANQTRLSQLATAIVKEGARFTQTPAPR